MSIRRFRKNPLMAEINITPFVDVMLVLLVVFMVTAPLLADGVKVDLPDNKAPGLTQSEEPLVISVQKNGTLWLQDTQIESQDELVERLKTIAGNNSELRIYIKGDKDLPYGTMTSVMGKLALAGFSKTALLVDSK